MSGYRESGHQYISNRLLQLGLIGFDWQDIIALSLSNMLALVSLGEHGIARHHPLLDVNLIQHVRRDDDRIFPMIHLCLHQHNSFQGT
jgi:hypothetical protein